MNVPILGELRCKNCNNLLGDRFRGKVAIVCRKSLRGGRCNTYNIFETKDYDSHEILSLENLTNIK